MSKAKYHHLVPQVYMKEWCHSGKSIYTFDKLDRNKINPRNIEKFGGIREYHSIKAGVMHCSNEDLKEIFKPLEGLTVKYNGETLKSFREYNNKYYDIDNWEILNNEGNKISSKSLNEIKQHLKNYKIVDIENCWDSKYESKWNLILEIIKQRIRDFDKEVDSFYKGFLMRWIVSLNWRAFKSDENFENVFDWFDELTGLSSIEIPEQNRILGKCDNASEEIKHNILLKKFDEFLNDKGPIYDMAISYIKSYAITFFVSECDTPFITSDNPSFSCTVDGKKYCFMPVTPNILINVVMDKEKKDKYRIERITDKRKVKELNKIIYDNAQQYIISNIDNIKILI